MQVYKKVREINNRYMYKLINVCERQDNSNDNETS